MKQLLKLLEFITSIFFEKSYSLMYIMWMVALFYYTDGILVLVLGTFIGNLIEDYVYGHLHQET